MDAIETLKNFMNAWKDSNWPEMFENSQITWRSRGRNKSIDLLKGWFHLKDLTTFKILKTEKISDSCVDITLKISYLYYVSNLKEVKIKARVICEIEPYKPSKDGIWGVNPVGILREF
jgi:hypothetical protein